MDDKRTGRLAENRLMVTIAGLEAELDDLKSPARQNMQSSIAFTQSDSGLAYDWSGILPQNPNSASTNQGLGNFIVTATGAGMTNLWANFIVNMYVGSPTSWYRPSNFLTDNINGQIGFQSYINDLPSTQSNVRNWYLSITGDRTRTLYLKVFVQALDSVTVGLAQR